MRRIVIHRRGGYDRLQLEEASSPVLGPGQVRIAVEACGVNYADCIVRMGLYKSARDFIGWPITPGFEVAGTVSEVGDGTDGFAVGDPVFAVTMFGGYSDEVVVPHNHVFRRPRGWSAEQAAAFAAVHLTAFYAIADLAAAKKGQTILVHSAAGGVGSVLVRLGCHFGCHVVGVVGGAHKVDHVRALGAHAVIDKSSTALWPAAEAQAPDGYAAIFDANGVATLRDSYKHIAPTGRLVVYGFASMLPRADERLSWLRLALAWLRTPRFDPLALTNENRSVMGFNLSYMFEHDALLERIMSQLLALAEEGVLPAPAVTRYALADVGRAHHDLETGRTVGKLVLVPNMDDQS